MALADIPCEVALPPVQCIGAASPAAAGLFWLLASHALRLGIESSGGGGSCVLWQNLHGTKTTSALLCLAMAPPMPANIFQNHTFYINDELKILIMAPFELIKGSNIPLGLAGLKCPIA